MRLDHMHMPRLASIGNPGACRRLHGERRRARGRHRYCDEQAEHQDDTGATMQSQCLHIINTGFRLASGTRRGHAKLTTLLPLRRELSRLLDPGQEQVHFPATNRRPLQPSRVSTLSRYRPCSWRAGTAHCAPPLAWLSHFTDYRSRAGYYRGNIILAEFPAMRDTRRRDARWPIRISRRTSFVARITLEQSNARWSASRSR